MELYRCLIRAYRRENWPKINSRIYTFIRHTRVVFGDQSLYYFEVSFHKSKAKWRALPKNIYSVIQHVLSCLIVKTFSFAFWKCLLNLIFRNLDIDYQNICVSFKMKHFQHFRHYGHRRGHRIVSWRKWPLTWQSLCFAEASNFSSQIFNP